MPSFHFNRRINRNKQNTFAREKPFDAEQFNLPSDWLQKLVDLCLETEAIPNLYQRFAAHVGDSSTYSLKNQLIESIQYIYVILNKQIPSIKINSSAVILKLIEEVDKCTPGFHNRVAFIIRSFSMPKTLVEFLESIRFSLVVSTAASVTDENHSANRFLTRAHQLGLRVSPLNQQDAYSGYLSDNFIQTLLKDAFSRHFTPASIMEGLFSEIHSILVTQWNYRGKLPAGESYKVEEYQPIVDFLQSFINKNLGLTDYFITDENYLLIELNWSVIRDELVRKLIAEKILFFKVSELELIEKIVRKTQMSWPEGKAIIFAKKADLCLLLCLCKDWKASEQ